LCCHSYRQPDIGFVMPLKGITADDMLSRVLYRDGLMLIVNKPAGLPVHRGPKGGASLEDYFDALRFGLPRPPALAHRLDKDTSGCLVLGRHRKALAHLGLLFKHGKVGKAYWAVVEGGPDADEGTVELSLGRLDETRGWWMKPDPNGLPSLTTWRVLGRSSPWPERGTAVCGADPGSGLPAGRADRASPALSSLALSNPSQQARQARVKEAEGSGRGPPQPGMASAVGRSSLRGGRSEAGAGSPDGQRKLTWLALTPVTGRTHQLRVHCAASGWPIVGDDIYGMAPRFSAPPQLLHAREVVVPISKNKAPVRVAAPVPAHMRDWLLACGWDGED
jgi:tRNA pseudouridine32 synthase / 23S rRNA pseudouridine746 synthase